AEQQWRAVIEQVPDYRPGWHMLGQLLLRTGRVVDAERLVDQLAAIPSSNGLSTEALVLRAAIEQRNGNVDAARSFLERAVHQAPTDVEALQVMARLLFENYGPAEAENVLVALVRA